MSNTIGELTFLCTSNVVGERALWTEVVWEQFRRGLPKRRFFPSKREVKNVKTMGESRLC